MLATGSVFAGHRVEALVGRGGMGVVYRARHLELDRVVALKVIGSEELEDRVVRERFLREAKAAASVDHPNVDPATTPARRTAWPTSSCASWMATTCAPWSAARDR